MKQVVGLFVIAGLAAGCGGGQRMDAPSPPPRLQLEALVGTWVAADSYDTITIGADGAFALTHSPMDDSGCEVAGTASLEPFENDAGLAYLSVKLTADSCRELVVFRTWAITAATAEELTLIERTESTPGPTVTYLHQPGDGDAHDPEAGDAGDGAEPTDAP